MVGVNDAVRERPRAVVPDRPRRRARSRRGRAQAASASSSGATALTDDAPRLDSVELAAIDSFPASDPPSWIGVSIRSRYIRLS